MIGACGDSGKPDDTPASTDLDGDGYGADDDCDDNDSAVNPGASDTVGDGVDNNCDGIDGIDLDADTYASIDSGGDDCDDADPSANPGGTEVPYDGIDQDCLGGDMVDVDGDGYVATEAGGDDCDDTQGLIRPQAPDSVGDGIDQNCDGIDGEDGDQDGYASDRSGGDDCDDGDALVNILGDDDWYDGIDGNCDGVCDYDQDGDGFVLLGYVSPDNGLCDTSPINGIIVALEDCDDEDANVGTNAVLNLYPYDGQTDAYYHADLDALLFAEDPLAVITLADDVGDVVPGVSFVDGTTVSFDPDLPLDPLSDYTATLTYMCGVVQWSFTTRDVSLPTDVLTLPGNGYLLDLMGGIWVEPAGVGLLIQQQLEAQVLIEILMADPDLAMRLALDELGNGAQDMCVATVEPAPQPFIGNPFFDIGPFDLPLGIQGINTTLGEVQLTGRFSVDGSYIDEISMRSFVDTRPLVPLIGGGAPDAVCQLVAAFGVNCDPCPSDGQPMCLGVLIENMRADLSPGLTVMPRSQYDVDNDPLCP